MKCQNCGKEYFFDDNYGSTYHCGDCYEELSKKEAELKAQGVLCCSMTDPGEPGEPGEPGLHNEEIVIKDYDELLRDNLKAINSSSFEPRPRRPSRHRPEPGRNAWY